MALDADIFHPEHTTLGLTPSGRIFKSFRRWPAVPVSDLLWLRHVLEPHVETDGLAGAHELLRLVDGELVRRSASLGGIPTANFEGPSPEAG